MTPAHTAAASGPTMDADFDLRRKGKTGIPVLDGTGQPLPSTLDLMALCRDAGIMLATGHSGPEASLALAKAAKNTHLEKFIVTPKEYKKDDRYVTMTIRIERTLQEAYDDLSTKTNRSRNELMGMALRYAIDNMELKDSE